MVRAIENRVDWQSCLMRGMSLEEFLSGRFCASFSTFSSDLDDWIVRALSKPADDMKVGEAAGIPEGCAAIQQDLRTLESRVERKLMIFNNGKSRVLQWVGNNCRHQLCTDVRNCTQVGAVLLERNSTENDPRVLEAEPWAVSWQCALGARKPMVS